MASATGDILREQFIAVTGAAPTEANQYLEMAGGDVERAIALFFDGDGLPAARPAQPQVLPTPQPVVHQPVPSPGTGRPTPGGHNQPKTFGDVRGDPTKNQENADTIENVFKTAQDGGAETFDESMFKDDPFAGTMNRLGEAGQRSVQVKVESKLPQRWKITFWKDCFTVNDGPPRRLDDPANRPFLEDINRQQIPREFGPVREADIELLDKRNEEWKAPPKDIKKFDGPAQSMGGGPTAGAQTAVAKAIVLDPSKPARSIKVRFAAGVVQVVKVNDDHTVNDLRCHLEAIQPCKKAFTIELNGVKLDNLNQTLKEAGAIGALVQQAL